MNTLNTIKTTLLFIFFSFMLQAQNERGINYQAAIRNSSGEIQKNKNIGIKFSILGENGEVLISESKTTTSNSVGLINLVIGENQSGGLSNINWSGKEAIKIEVDLNGGTNYSVSETHPFQYVPYAFYAKNVDIASLQNSIESNKKENFSFVSTIGNLVVYDSQKGEWKERNGYLSQGSDIVESKGSFAYFITTGYVVVYDANKNDWTEQQGYVNGGTSIVKADGNFAFSATTGDVYAYNALTSTWVVQRGTLRNSKIYPSGKNFAFASTTGFVYVFDANTNTWKEQQGYLADGTDIIGTDGNFAYATTDGRVYAYSKGNFTLKSGYITTGTKMVSSVK